jgi:hypothetical protein
LVVDAMFGGELKVKLEGVATTGATVATVPVLIPPVAKKPLPSTPMAVPSARLARFSLVLLKVSAPAEGTTVAEVKSTFTALPDALIVGVPGPVYVGSPTTGASNRKLKDVPASMV